MFPPQNPDLQPESMWNYEIALTQALLDGRFKYGVNVFYIDGKNLIVTLPNPNGTGMLNQNSGTIYNSGVELQAAYRINKEWSVDGNYSFLHMENPVIAAPEHKLYAEPISPKAAGAFPPGCNILPGCTRPSATIRNRRILCCGTCGALSASASGLTSGCAVRTCWRRNTRSMPVIPCRGQPSWPD